MDGWADNIDIALLPFPMINICQSLDRVPFRLSSFQADLLNVKKKYSNLISCIFILLPKEPNHHCDKKTYIVDSRIKHIYNEVE